MKIRKGFVSNSSSSSFIIEYYCKKKILTKKEVEKILNKLVEIHHLVNPRASFDKIFSFKADPEEMCIGKKGEDFLEMWVEHGKRYHDDKIDIKKGKNKIMVHSAEENSIPHWMNIFIRDELAAKSIRWS